MEKLQDAMPVEKQNRVVYFDFLRIIAIIAVITQHVAGNWKVDDVHSFAWLTFNFFNSIGKWGAPAFIMISGALFLSLEKQISIKTMYKKYIFRIVVAYIVWSFFYVVVYILKKDEIINPVAEFIGGHYHMWFLLTLVGLYIIVPLLRYITASKEGTRYFLLVSFVFTFLIPMFLLGIKFIDISRGGDSDLYKFANRVYGDMNYYFGMGYCFYFVCGHYLNTIEIKLKWEILVYSLGLLGFSLTVLLTKWISFYHNSPDYTFYWYTRVNVLLESLSVFVFAKNRIPKLLKSERAKKVAGKLSKYSFGVYLVHAFFIEIMDSFGLNTLTFNPVISVIVIVLIVSVLSFVVSAVLNHIPVVKKYLV